MRRFQIIWKDGSETYVHVDESAQRLYASETRFEVAATLACQDNPDKRADIKYVREA